MKRHLVIALVLSSLGAAYAADVAVKPGSATAWHIVPDKSEIGFTAFQAGAAFKGTFQKFTGDIRFDPQNLAQSSFDVSIELASVSTGDKERDNSLIGVDFFWAQRQPQAHYVAQSFTAAGAGKFIANGQLTLRGVTRDVPVVFTLDSSGKTAVMKGGAEMKRLDFRVGVGEWENTESINNEVKPSFTLTLKRD